MSGTLINVSDRSAYSVFSVEDLTPDYLVS